MRAYLTVQYDAILHVLFHTPFVLSIRAHYRFPDDHNVRLLQQSIHWLQRSHLVILTNLLCKEVPHTLIIFRLYYDICAKLFYVPFFCLYWLLSRTFLSTKVYQKRVDGTSILSVARSIPLYNWAWQWCSSTVNLSHVWTLHLGIFYTANLVSLLLNNSCMYLGMACAFSALTLTYTNSLALTGGLTRLV